MTFITRHIYLLVFLLSFNLTACSTEESVKKNISVHQLKKTISLNENCNGVRILKVYLNEETCTSRQINANLYLCERDDTHGLLYVFELCDRAPYYVNDSTTWFCIMKEDIKKVLPENVTVKVPPSFSIPKNAECVFSRFLFLID